MIPAAFDYVRAESADHAIALLGELGDEAKLLAGGHSLVPMMKLRLAVPTAIVDVGRLDELSYVRQDGGHVAIGALTTHHDIETNDLLRSRCPLVPGVAAVVGDPQVRHCGTIGGSLAHADPASDLPAAILALGATLVAQGPHGRREIPAADFFTGFFESALAADEMLVEVRVPMTPGARWSYQKFNRRAQDWAIVGVAVVHNGHTGIGLVNMASTPLRATAAETALASGSTASDAAMVADDGTDPMDDLNAGPDYRRHLARVLTRRALNEVGVA